MEIELLKIKNKTKWLRLRIVCDVHSTLQRTEEKKCAKTIACIQTKKKKRKELNQREKER